MKMVLIMAVAKHESSLRTFCSAKCIKEMISSLRTFCSAKCIKEIFLLRKQKDETHQIYSLDLYRAYAFKNSLLLLSKDLGHCGCDFLLKLLYYSEQRPHSSLVANTLLCSPFFFICLCPNLSPLFENGERQSLPIRRSLSSISCNQQPRLVSVGQDHFTYGARNGSHALTN